MLWDGKVKKPMNRRSFLGALAAAAGAMILPYEPKRVYSFARELRVPGVEEFVPGWHRLTITWDGTKARGLVDDRVVVEGSCPPDACVFFEYDPLVSGNWRARLADYPMMMRGNTVIDYRAGWSPQKFRPCMADSATPRTLEMIVRLPDTADAHVLRLGWG